MTWSELRRRLRRTSVPVITTVWPLARLWYRRWGLSLEGRPDDQVWYFAYGANINDLVFRERRGMRPSECCVGRLPGYRLRFNLDGRPKGGSAPANISIDPDGEVWGVLYRITRRDLVRLNASEGIPGRRYRPIFCRRGGRRSSGTLCRHVLRQWQGGRWEAVAALHHTNPTTSPPPRAAPALGFVP